MERRKVSWINFGTESEGAPPTGDRERREIRNQRALLRERETIGKRKRKSPPKRKREEILQAPCHPAPGSSRKEDKRPISREGSPRPRHSKGDTTPLLDVKEETDEERTEDEASGTGAQGGKSCHHHRTPKEERSDSRGRTERTPDRGSSPKEDRRRSPVLTEARSRGHHRPRTRQGEPPRRPTEPTGPPPGVFTRPWRSRSRGQNKGRQKRDRQASIRAYGWSEQCQQDRVDRYSRVYRR